MTYEEISKKYPGKHVVLGNVKYGTVDQIESANVLFSSEDFSEAFEHKPHISDSLLIYINAIDMMGMRRELDELLKESPEEQAISVI
jgi:hypothetical protein